MIPVKVALWWRVPATILFGTVCLVIVVLVGDQDLQLPMAAGPRQIRHAVLMIVPAVLSAFLLPPLPDIHPSLVRSRLHFWVSRGLFWVVVVAVWLGAWGGIAISRGLLLFEMMSAFLMTAATLFLVPRYGARVLVGLTILGSAWLLYGMALGIVMGFCDLQVNDPDPYASRENPHVWILAVISFATCVAGSWPSRPGSSDG